MTYSLIQVRTEADKVGVITLNRPKQLNALNGELMDELGQALTALQNMPARVAVPILRRLLSDPADDLRGVWDDPVRAGADPAVVHSLVAEAERLLADAKSRHRLEDGAVRSPAPGQVGTERIGVDVGLADVAGLLNLRHIGAGHEVFLGLLVCD